MTDIDEQPLKPRTAREAAERLLALIAVTSRAHEDVAAETLYWVQENKIERFFSTEERVFYFLGERPNERDQTSFSWRAEALVSVLWALGGMEELPPLNEQADIWSFPKIQDAVSSPANFVSGAVLRPAAEIEELESELHHQHWRVRDAQIFSKPLPTELHAGVVYERRYGLSWLVGWGDDWDDVPTDT